jgi:triphosphoribosyl-dephospho-CoA synthase
MNWQAQVGHAAVRALYAEVSLEPKPGLVSFRDQGSHQDMDGSTFLRSLFALRGYFPRMAQAGWQGLQFAELQALGLQAESRMLAATSGINTHRGAIFGLGLLCASAGQVQAQRLALTPQNLRDVMLATWGQALGERTQVSKLSLALSSTTSNGQQVARRFGLRSAGDEAALGFPCLFDVTWPALQQALEGGAGERAARVHALFATMAVLDDTNLVHRGGLKGLRFAQSLAKQFLASGSVFQADWLARARAVHSEFVRRNLSPGGSADVLASACWINAVCKPSQRAAIAVCDRGDQQLVLTT